MTSVAATTTTRASQACHNNSTSSASSSNTSLTFSRTWLAAVAKENMDIAQNGYYINSHGEKVAIRNALNASIRNSKLYHYKDKISNPNNNNSSTSHDTKINVCYSAPIKAALALQKTSGDDVHVGVLNSADGFNPGGKFVKGCLSLEACICRSTLLWSCLDNLKGKANSMYKVNNNDVQFRDGRNPSSCAIYTPNVPIIRKDSLKALLLDQYVHCSFVSLPPPNAFALQSKEEIREKLKEHLSRALYIFAENGCTDLALCSYGCGTRGNDPCMVAEVYHDLLTKDLKGVFNRVIFVINPKKQAQYEAFASKFEEGICN